jgi:hypothetical protein
MTPPAQRALNSYIGKMSFNLRNEFWQGRRAVIREQGIGGQKNRLPRWLTRGETVTGTDVENAATD